MGMGWDVSSTVVSLTWIGLLFSGFALMLFLQKHTQDAGLRRFRGTLLAIAVLCLSLANFINYRQ
jgi:hypothetical protein